MLYLESIFQYLLVNVRRAIKRPIALSAALAAFLVAITIVVLAQSTSTTLDSGSFLSVSAQVTSSSNGNTNSIDAISANDIVQWTTNFQSKLDKPYKSVSVVAQPPGFKWQNEALKLPDKTTLRWCTAASCADGGWLTTQPATGTVVTFVEWTINPLITLDVVPSVPSAVNFTGTGDGFRVITNKQKLWVINHHITSNYLNCRDAEKGVACAGYEAGGKTISDIEGQPVYSAVSTPLSTPQRSIEHFDAVSGNMYIYFSGANGAVKVKCVNLNTVPATTCMNTYSVGTSSIFNNDFVYNGPINPVGSVNGKYYAMMADSKVACFDIATRANCEGYPLKPSGWSGEVLNKASIVLLGNQFFVSTQSSSSLRCFDTLTNTNCAGWDGTTSAGSWLASDGAFAVLNSDGSPKGVCASISLLLIYNVKCKSISNISFEPSTNYKNFLNQNGGWTTGYGYGYATSLNMETFGTKVFQTKSFDIKNIVACFDFATDQTCDYGVNGNNGTLSSTGSNAAIYSIVKDTERPNCMWAIGDAALAKSFNPSTGDRCPDVASIPPVLDLSVEPAGRYACDGSKARVNSWGKIRFSDSLSWTKLKSMTAVIFYINAQGNAVLLPAALKPERPFIKDRFELDISDIPYSTYPKLKIQLKVVADNFSSSTQVGFDVTWDGDPVQLCFKTQAPTLDNCQVSVKVDQTNVTLGNYKSESLTATNGLTPGRTQNGWGPGVTSTTLRQFPTGSSDPTQILQTRYNMNNLTGDLWQYKMLADYSLELTSSSKASLFTGTRTLYTSKLDTSGGLVLTNLIYANLSTAQQTELNKTASGIVDALGTNRVSYLAGTDGSFRARSSVLGTAIDSSPTVLDKVALAGYNDALFPGYPAYRKALSRPDRLAFYQSNDGFLHAYKVKDNVGLIQAFSFMPGMLLKRVQDFTDSTTAQLRSNPYWLDNTPMVAEVNLGNGTVTDKDKWTSVVVANQGRGGRGVYAIEVKSGGLDKVLFEYDNTSHADLKDLGYVMGQPPADLVTGADQIARMSNGRFAYIMGNGVDSNKGPVSLANGLGQAFLYVFYLDGGTGGVKWHKIPVPDTSLGNGLGTPRPIYDQDTGKVSLIYAGDMKGNMWRFDVSDITNMTGKVTKLFKASAGQAIYTAPIVTKSGAGDCGANDFKKCWMVTFGTGDPLNVLTTSNNTSTQSIYGVYDKGDTSTTYTPANLVSQTLGANETIAGSIQRKVSATTIAYTSTIRGWKIPLSAAEHVSANPAMLPSKNIMIASTRPAGASAASCGPSASWLTTINPNSGSGSSVEVKGPVISEPQPLCRGDKLRCDDIKIPLPGLNSSLPVGVETCLPTGLTTSGAKCLFEADGSLKTPNASMVGRLSWREVFGLPK